MEEIKLSDDVIEHIKDFGCDKNSNYDSWRLTYSCLTKLYLANVESLN